MKLKLEGLFRIQQYRANKLIKDIVLPNSLTKRGAIEFMTRFIGVSDITEAEGRQVADDTNIFSTRIGIIEESGFVALDREDRIQYYDAVGDPVPALGDNRQWQDGGILDDVEWSRFLSLGEGEDTNIYPRLNLPKPSPFVKEATFTTETRPGSQEWRGLYINHSRTGVGLPNVEAILATAILPEKLVVNANDFVKVSWTLKLNPTFV